MEKLYIPLKVSRPSNKLLGEIGGYAGMALLQGATLPQIYDAIFSPETANLAPLSMVLMVWAGLLLYFIRAFVQRDMLYLISNGIGLVCNFILMIIIIWGN